MMDGAELDLNSTLLSSSSPSSKSIIISNDYEKDLRLAAELGRCLLEQNHDLQNYINVLEKQLDETRKDMKLLQAKLSSTRDQLDEKNKQTDVLDAANYDLEQELVAQRRDNEKNRQQIKELFHLCETTRKQCHDIEQEYERFRSKRLVSYLPSTLSISSPSPTPSPPRQRAHSFNFKSIIPSSPPSLSSSLDFSSATVYQSHLRELKSRIQSLTSDCATLTEQLQRSEEEKHFLLDRLTQLERQRRDDNDSLQQELNHCRKLLKKFSHVEQSSRCPTIKSLAEHDLSLFEEVQLETNPSTSIYESTNYRALFAPLYEKLKIPRT